MINLRSINRKYSTSNLIIIWFYIESKSETHFNTKMTNDQLTIKTITVWSLDDNKNNNITFYGDDLYVLCISSYLDNVQQVILLTKALFADKHVIR